MKKKKVLYFEGAGMDYNNKGCDIGNYRIRTAFLNNNNRPIYLEISNNEFRGKKHVEWRACVQCAFFIEDNKDDIKYLERQLPKIEECSRQGITKWINENFNCSFDDIEVLSWFSGYRVFNGNGGYNLIDNFVVDHELARKREEAYNRIDQEFRRKLNSKYSKIHVHGMDENAITVRCYASKEELQRAGLTEADRIQVVQVV